VTATAAPSIPRRFTCHHKVHFWGHDYDVKPAVAKGYLGDGRQLLRFQPLSTRPDYYLIRIDSSWAVDDSDEWYDRLDDEILQMLIDEFSEKEREREYLAEDLRAAGIEPDETNTDLAGNEGRLGFPVLSLDSGYSWSSIATFNGKRWVF
jgi:hypothetical protein